MKNQSGVKITLLSVAALLVTCFHFGYANPTSSYGQQQGQGVQASANGGDYSSPNYQFGYSVYDPSNSNDFMHEEERNDQVTKGQYRVMLPDGRLQIVTYTADQNGYRAEVTYQDSGSKVAPSYNSTPTHAPAPPPPTASIPNRYQSQQTRDPSRTYSRVRATVAGQQYQYSY